MPTPFAPTAPRPEQLQACTDDRTFRRGLEYFQDGAVGPLRLFEGGVRATVRGAEPYDTWLTPQDSEQLDHSCSCPVGVSGELCKHVVALGLRWHQADQAGEALAPAPHDSPSNELAALLAGAAPADLVRWLQWAVNETPSLRARITLAARHRPAERAQVIRRDLIARLREMAATDTYDAEGLLADELAQAYVSLTDLSDEAPQETLTCVQDMFDDMAAAKAESLHWNQDAQRNLLKLYRLHLMLARQLRPDPQALADWLFVRGCDDDDCMPDLPQPYGSVLGAEGLTRFHARVSQGWEALPVHNAGTPRGTIDVARQFLQTQMERQVQHASVLERVRVLQKDLSTARRYARILECLTLADTADTRRRAARWAEQASEAFPTDEALASCAAEAHLRIGAETQAHQLMDRLFRAGPSARRYQLGARVLASAPAVREKFCADALALLRDLHREQVAAARKRTTRSKSKLLWTESGGAEAPYQPRWREELARVLIDRGDGDDVWSLQQSAPLSDKLWSSIAELRAATHLEDALALWQKLMPVAMARSSTDYAEPGAIVRAIHEACLTHGTRADFEREQAALRQAYGRRRNFLKHLDRLR